MCCFLFALNHFKNIKFIHWFALIFSLNLVFVLPNVKRKHWKWNIVFVVSVSYVFYVEWNICCFLFAWNHFKNIKIVCLLCVYTFILYNFDCLSLLFIISRFKILDCFSFTYFCCFVLRFYNVGQMHFKRCLQPLKFFWQHIILSIFITLLKVTSPCALISTYFIYFLVFGKWLTLSYFVIWLWRCRKHKK